MAFYTHFNARISEELIYLHREQNLFGVSTLEVMSY